jgi:hypothetical protein
MATLRARMAVQGFGMRTLRLPTAAQLARRPLRDVCSVRRAISPPPSRLGVLSFLNFCGFDGGLSLLHAGVLPRSNVRPSGLGSSCDGEKSALALSLQRRFCRLPPTDGSCGSVRLTSVPELMSA